MRHGPGLDAVRFHGKHLGHTDCRWFFRAPLGSVGSTPRVIRCQVHDRRGGDYPKVVVGALRGGEPATGMPCRCGSIGARGQGPGPPDGPRMTDRGGRAAHDHGGTGLRRHLRRPDPLTRGLPPAIFPSQGSLLVFGGLANARIPGRAMAFKAAALAQRATAHHGVGLVRVAGGCWTP